MIPSVPADSLIDYIILRSFLHRGNFHSSLKAIFQCAFVWRGCWLLAPLISGEIDGDINERLIKNNNINDDGTEIFFCFLHIFLTVLVYVLSLSAYILRFFCVIIIIFRQPWFDFDFGLILFEFSDVMTQYISRSWGIKYIVCVCIRLKKIYIYIYSNFYIIEI